MPKRYNIRNAAPEENPMSATDKQPPTGMQVERQVERFLAERIPAGWSLRARRTESLGRYRVDLLAEVASPAGESAVLAVEIKRALEPRDVSRVRPDRLQYTDDGSRATGSGGPRGHVLLEPLDPVVFDRTIERDGLRCVAPGQLAVDLLTGPGREPSQGEEMLVWMERNEHVWRS